MKTPLHLWIVGALSLLWNAGGAVDYVLTRTRNPDYLATMPPEALAMVEAAPLWFDVAWAVGVWSAVAGSLLLLLRSPLAAPAFGLSLLGLVVSSLYSYLLADPGALAVLGPSALLFSAAIVVVLVGLWLYARAMAPRFERT